MSGWGLVRPGETPIDVSGLKRKGINTRAELNRAEAENIRKAVVKYLAAKPSRRSALFTLPWAKRFHKQMFGDVSKWAGAFRQENLNLGCDWHQVQMQVQTLLDDIVFWQAREDNLLDRAARLHHRAVWIHPFPNGNGRWARMLANIWLKRHGHAITEWLALFGLFAEVERDLISERTKEGLAAARAKGRPKGSVGTSKLDGKEEEIRILMEKRVAKASIAKIVGVSPTNLRHFIQTRKLAPEASRGRDRQRHP